MTTPEGPSAIVAGATIAEVGFSGSKRADAGVAGNWRQRIDDDDDDEEEEEEDEEEEEEEELKEDEDEDEKGHEHERRPSTGKMPATSPLPSSATTKLPTPDTSTRPLSSVIRR